MNTEAEIETQKRLKLVDAFAKEIQADVLGIILFGSTAYAPNFNVRKDSDEEKTLTKKHFQKMSHFVHEMKRKKIPYIKPKTQKIEGKKLSDIITQLQQDIK